MAGRINACSDTLTALTTSLLGFSLVSPPAVPAPFSLGSLNDKLTKDVFDQNAAAQLIREAALTERLMAGNQLSKAIQKLAVLATAAVSNSAPQSEPKKLQKDVQKSLRTVNQELVRYNARIASSVMIHWSERALVTLLQHT